MELGEWIGGWIIEYLDNRGSEYRGSIVLACCWLTIFSVDC